MKSLTEELQNTVNSAYGQLAKLTEAESVKPVATGKWSRKEIIGHLIDSASNNHQRFVRGQLVDDLSLPGYEQEPWVATQDYRNEPWADLLTLWQSYNLHLAHVIAAIPETKLEHRCRIGDSEPVTLRFVAEDYVRHLQHHLSQALMGI